MTWPKLFCCCGSAWTHWLTSCVVFPHPPARHFHPNSPPRAPRSQCAKSAGNSIEMGTPRACANRLTVFKNGFRLPRSKMKIDLRCHAGRYADGADDGKELAKPGQMMVGIAGKDGF